MLKIEIYLLYNVLTYIEEFFDVFSTEFNKILNSVESNLSIKSYNTKFYYYDCLNLITSYFSRKNKYY
jgi:hypothetical protein